MLIVLIGKRWWRDSLKVEFPKLLEKILKDFLEREMRERVIGVYFPSEINYCLRRLYFMYKKPKKFDIETLKIFESGNIFHSWFQNVLLKAYLKDEIHSFDYEVPLEHKVGDVTIKGRPDDIITVSLGGEKLIIEIKTARSIKMIDKPKEHHASQLNFYLTVFGVKNGYIIYIDRSNLQHKIFQMEQSDDMMKKIEKRALLLHKFLVEDKVPFEEGKIEKGMRWNCDYCNYKTECLELL